ncbi:MAG TPA: GAF domain-containing protein [Candidatus Aquilonibacter sp.]|nr:GAF domain-containing protein [Candidatus Aquilonibacter sp.]
MHPGRNSGAQVASNIVIEQSTKPALDQQTFEKILEAAFVLQEHNRRMRQLEVRLESRGEKLREEETIRQSLLKKTKPDLDEPLRPNPDYTLTLAEIVEAQYQIQTRHFELSDATAVVAERIARITRASGAGIGILEGANVRYLAGAGSPALPVGTEVPFKTAVCQANIRTGQVIRTKDVDTEFLFDPEPVRQRGIRSLVAVPIHYDGNIIGGLELYFDRVEGYVEQDIHTCQLMAGLVTEAVARRAGAALKESMAAERSSMLAAIEKLQPKLSAMATAASSNGCGESVSTKDAGAETIVCSKCGHDLMPQEQFCGKCGASRVQATGGSGVEVPATISAEFPPMAASARSAIEEPLPFTEDEADALANSLASLGHADSEIVAPSSDVPAALQGEMVWTSAARAQDFFESLAETPNPGALRRFWRSRKGDFYLAVAIAVVVAVIGWGIWSNESVNAKVASATSKKANQAKLMNADAKANLSTFDKFLIAVGVAEAPDPPDHTYQGNPDTQVWVDVNTAQYYCPGSDLYQKTEKGKLTSQRNAQLDQFEPAYRQPCN